jgi:hypothetical protein
VSKYLGSERSVTQDFVRHNYQAEDYAGIHLSEVRIYGKAKVVSVINKFKSYEDTIDHSDFLKNMKRWQKGKYYDCVSITNKIVRYYVNELGGNQVTLEFYVGNKVFYLVICHMAKVLVKVGDIITDVNVIGLQGNTGLVSSRKKRTDKTYGSHIHVQVKDNNGKYINPRNYAMSNIRIDYK